MQGAVSSTPHPGWGTKGQGDTVRVRRLEKPAELQFGALRRWAAGSGVSESRRNYGLGLLLPWAHTDAVVLKCDKHGTWGTGSRQRERVLSAPPAPTGRCQSRALVCSVQAATSRSLDEK